MRERCTARPVGRVVRLLVGIALTIVVGRHLFSATASLYVQVLVGMAGLLLFHGLVHLLLSKYIASIHHCFGAAIAVGPVCLVFFLGGTTGQLSTLLFVGVSLLVAAARADAGCEVMSIPSLVLGGSTHLTCIVFSPIDWVEDRIARIRE